MAFLSEIYGFILGHLTHLRINTRLMVYVYYMTNDRIMK